MSEQEQPERESTESGGEASENAERKPGDKKKRAADTFTDDNPLICRGVD